MVSAGPRRFITFYVIRPCLAATMERRYMTFADVSSTHLAGRGQKHADDVLSRLGQACDTHFTPIPHFEFGRTSKPGSSSVLVK